MAVRNAINSYGSKWQTILSRTFSAEILYNSLCKDNKGNKYISDKALAHMRRVTLGMDNDKDIEYLMMLVLSQQKESKKLSEAFNDWLTDNNCKPDKNFLTISSFILWWRHSIITSGR